MFPSSVELQEVVKLRHDEDPPRLGWAALIRQRYGYFTPDEIYEAVIEKLATPGCSWLDVGCGRQVFPNNRRLAEVLADRCDLLVGVDPDATIEENEVVHQKARCTLEEFESDRTFDLITMRMVAEHVVEPERLVARLARLTAPGSRVVIYTVNRWSPVSLLSRVVPFWLHHPIKRWAWRTEEKDTFPVAYQMNTRRQLKRLFHASGFRELQFSYLDDCRTLARFAALLHAELSGRRLLRSVGLKYPENCLLGIYGRLGEPA